MRHFACLVINPITFVTMISSLKHRGGSDLMTVLTHSLSLAGPTVAKLEVFVSSEYMLIVSHFLCFNIVHVCKFN